LPKHYYVKKPKLLKQSSKTHRLVEEMCYAITDHLEEWLMDQQILVKQVRQETKEKEKEKKINFEEYCTNEYKRLCDKESIDLTLTYFKLKMKYTPRRLLSNKEKEESLKNQTVNNASEVIIPNDTESNITLRSTSNTPIHVEVDEDAQNKDSENDQIKVDL